MNSDLEKKLIAACRNGDASAYVGLVRAYSGRVFAICLGMLGHREDAEDIAQQTLLKGFTDIRKLHDSERFGAWICRIAKNLCIDFLRRYKHRQIVPFEQTDALQNNSKEHPELQKVLVKLPEDCRLVLALYYFDGKSAKNIAETFEISQAAVHARLSRARKRLRGLLETQGDVL